MIVLLKIIELQLTTEVKMVYDYNKDELKNNLTLDQVSEYVAELGGEPQERNGILMCKTICHCGESHKLYYYPNTTLFKCYTDCSETFDIFELTRKVLSRERPKAREESDWNLPEAIEHVAQYFHFAPNVKTDEHLLTNAEDFKILEKYDRISNININTQEVELKVYEGGFLKNLPRPRIQPWIEEGITQEVMNNRGICYDPKNCGIVIPHYDIDGRLIGIRERTLVQDVADKYGKYRPAQIAGNLYNHPLSFNLYGLNWNKDNIRRMRKVFVFEGEKSVLKYASYFGEENDLSVAVCGSSFINYQAWLLINQGVEEIIICLDKQFKEVGDDEFKKLVRNLKQIHKKYGGFVTISYMFDKWGLLGYKDSPIDQGKETFLELYKRRVNLYNEI